MSDDWEVKKVTRSGSDYNIRVGPKNSDNGIAEVFGALLMTYAAFSLFGLGGFGSILAIIISILWYCFAFNSAALVTIVLLVCQLVAVNS